MKKEKSNWSTDPKNKVTNVQKLLSSLSLRAREEQFRLFWKLLKPNKSSRVLDVGFSPRLEPKDTNFFEKRYPYLNKLTVVSVEKVGSMAELYPKIKFVEVKPNRKLPFKSKSFDIVVSWATLEHVGSRNNQKNFIAELFRLGKKVFVTTPNKNFIYELHSGLFLVHWLPQKYFATLCRLLKRDFWSKKSNLNLLNKKDLINLISKNTYSKIKVLTFIMFRVLPSHLIMIKYHDQDK